MKSSSLDNPFIKWSLMIIASISILVTFFIIITLFKDTIPLFTGIEEEGIIKKIGISEFLLGTKWGPTYKPASFGVIPIVVGTFMVVIFSCLVAIPLGLGSAIYLSEYASPKVKGVLKPILEVLAGIPSIVYGFFALQTITPALKVVFPSIEVFNVLSASIAVGIMITPMIASVSEDALNAVPKSIKNASYGVGATKYETVLKVTLPAALSGVVASFVLAISRAIGETMVVAIAAGSNPRLNFNPFKSIQTMTGYMVNASLGDIQHGTQQYHILFAVGLLLFTITFVLNIVASKIVNRYREKY